MTTIYCQSLRTGFHFLLPSSSPSQSAMSLNSCLLLELDLFSSIWCTKYSCFESHARQIIGVSELVNLSLFLTYRMDTIAYGYRLSWIRMNIPRTGCLYLLKYVILPLWENKPSVWPLTCGAPFHLVLSAATPPTVIYVGILPLFMQLFMFSLSLKIINFYIYYYDVLCC